MDKKNQEESNYQKVTDMKSHFFEKAHNWSGPFETQVQKYLSDFRLRIDDEANSEFLPFVQKLFEETDKEVNEVLQKKKIALLNQLKTLHTNEVSKVLFIRNVQPISRKIQFGAC